MEHIKLQASCLLVILYVGLIYIRERRRLRQNDNSKFYNALLIAGFLTVIFDGITAYTVNNLSTVNETFNLIMHMFFLIGLDTNIFLLFLYMLSITSGFPKKKRYTVALVMPFVVNVIVVILNMPTLEYRRGVISNYSMGMSAYTCFVIVAVYILFSIAILVKRWYYIESHKRWNVFTYLMILAGITTYQMIYPEALITSLCLTIIIIGIYVNQENPTVKELTNYHEEMIMGFATLVENKDGSTGEHIRRILAYVKLIVKELQKNGYYKNVLTKDYTDNIYKAAPMHDIGKMAIRDEILQKKGRLTDEEYEIMKQHAVKGGEIIMETFGHLGNFQYSGIAYDVARYHHEKWDGTGYPEGLKGEEIPLCARIMAVADVFDALSEKRCYREAMPLENCFEIIKKGRGTDFDPLIVDMFMNIRDEVEKVHKDSIIYLEDDNLFDDE